MPQNTGLAIFDLPGKATKATMGEPMTLTRAGQAPVEVTGVFDGRHIEIEMDGEVGLSDYQVTAHLRREDAGDVAEDDLVEARGACYKVVDTRPDSENWIVLALALVNEPDPA
ncbi:MAG: hypothetical protein AAF942_00100 [Pseudomonadota bacterium]